MAGEGKKEEREKVEVRKGGRNGRGSREEGGSKEERRLRRGKTDEGRKKIGEGRGKIVHLTHFLLIFC